MSEESLREQVAKLRSELAHAHRLDDPTRQALHDLARELEAAADQSPGAVPSPALTLRERVSDRIREVEASHPRIAATLGNIVDTLAFYGL
jgi:uncharacterized protein DUF4404